MKTSALAGLLLVAAQSAAGEPHTHTPSGVLEADQIKALLATLPEAAGRP